MKSKNFVWILTGLTAVLTIPQINSAQVIVCPRNRLSLTAQERRECDVIRVREERERAARERESRQPAAREAAQHRLEGTWYLNGDRNKPCQIFGGGFEAKNERGDTTRLVYVHDHRDHSNDSMFIRASNWDDLRGEVRYQYFQGEQHQSIEWANGTKWTRVR